MSKNSSQINLQEFRYRFWLSLFFALICFVIAIVSTHKLSSDYILSLKGSINSSGSVLITDLENLVGLNLVTLTTVLSIGTIGSILIGYLYLKKYREEWTNTRDVLDDIACGNPPSTLYSSETEFKEIYDTAFQVGEIYNGLQELREKISKGEFDDKLDILKMDNNLGRSGAIMLQNLKELTTSSNLRLWVNESLNELSDIMRSDRKDIDLFTQNILGYIVNKTKANIGAIYVLNEAEASNPYMELINCYAYSRRKLVEARIYEGEGLIGRLWQEKKAIMITDVPDDYCKIITNVGDAKPKCMLLLPMLMDQKIVGAIEIAGFNHFNDHQIEFVQKAINSFASVYSNIKTEENTRQLLEEAQQLSEETRASEEEIRQNMEELQAIQEELLRKEKETDRLMNEAKERERKLQDEIERLKEQLELTNA